MDVLLIASIYTLCFLFISCLIFFEGQGYLNTEFVRCIRRGLLSVLHLTKSGLQRFLPSSLTHGVSGIVSYVLFTRNPCVQLFYGFLVTGGTAVYTFKVLYYFDKINIFSVLTYVFIGVNVTLFWKCSVKDPGIITSLTHKTHMDQYKADGLFYTGKTCYTCKLVKPARSKHCSICDVCISRFDHHCTWVNNCIGQSNYKFFLGFILSTAILCLYTSFVVLVVFAYIVLSEGLMTMHYVDHDGQHYPVGIRIICQYLLVHQPLIFILFLTVLLFGLAMTGFSLFHAYLVLTNQTTNEFYKRFHNVEHIKRNRHAKSVQPKYERSSSQITSRRRMLAENKEFSQTLIDNTLETSSYQRTSTPYYKGVWNNIVEVIQR